MFKSFFYRFAKSQQIKFVNNKTSPFFISRQIRCGALHQMPKSAKNIDSYFLTKANSYFGIIFKNNNIFHMLLAKEKFYQTRSSSVKIICRQKSMIKIPTTSQIPRDFFRQPKSIDKCDINQISLKNPLEFTFMPNKFERSQFEKIQLKKSLDLPRKPASAIRRIGRLTLGRREQRTVQI